MRLSRLSADARREQTRHGDTVQMPDGSVATAVYGKLPDPRAEHQREILRDFQTAEETNEQAQRCLAYAEQVAAQSSIALVEARKRMRRVSEGLV